MGVSGLFWAPHILSNPGSSQPQSRPGLEHPRDRDRFSLALLVAFGDINLKLAVFDPTFHLSFALAHHWELCSPRVRVTRSIVHRLTLYRSLPLCSNRICIDLTLFTSKALLASPEGFSKPSLSRPSLPIPLNQASSPLSTKREIVTKHFRFRSHHLHHQAHQD